MKMEHFEHLKKNVYFLKRYTQKFINSKNNNKCVEATLVNIYMNVDNKYFFFFSLFELKLFHLMGIKLRPNDDTIYGLMPFQQSRTTSQNKI